MRRVLYDPAPAAEKRTFPKRFLFTGWFDTGKQGREWPGDFEIVFHEQPLTWDAARSVLNKQTGAPWLRIDMHGGRRLDERVRLRRPIRLPLTRSLKLPAPRRAC